MKSFSKFLIGGVLACGAIFSHNLLAVTGNADVIPPKGIVKVQGATLKDGVYYTNSLNVVLNIEATDNVTSTENLKMIVSNGPISGSTAIAEANWENFSNTKNWTLPSASEENLIYLYLKDEAENISPNIVVDASSNYTVTYAGLGDNLPSPKSAQYGMLFNVSIQEPTLEGKYFLGWSLVNGATTPQFLSDSVIEPKYIKSDITLYSVWSDEAPLLADMVQIGDYVDYPVAYENIFTSGTSYKSAYTGWRVLDVTDGNVTLVSAGTPLLYYHGNNSSASVTNLTTNFLNNAQYSTSGINSLDLAQAFNNVYTQSVVSMNKADIDKIVGETTNSGYGIRRFGSLLDNGTYYWLATANYSNNLWNVNGYGGNVNGINNTSYGVRPKVSLVSNIRTPGRNISGVWRLEEP